MGFYVFKLLDLCLYFRCPASNDCAAIDLDRAEPDTPPHCCENLEDGQKCQPDCVRAITNDETAIASEVGLFYHFDTDLATGQPLSPSPNACPGFEGKRWNLKSWKKRKGAQVTPKCTIHEDYTPDGTDGEMLFELVEEFADDQDTWYSDFVQAFESMVSNGYNDDELMDGPNDLWHII